MRHKVARAHQPGFLGPKKQEHDGASGAVFGTGVVGGQLQEQGHAAGVVVGSGEINVFAHHAQVVVVGGDNEEGIGLRRAADDGGQVLGGVVALELGIDLNASLNVAVFERHTDWIIVAVESAPAWHSGCQHFQARLRSLI